VECESQNDISNNKGNWNHIKIIQTQYLSNIRGKHEIKKLQKAAILGTAHILRKVLISKYKTYFTCEITLHVAEIVNTEQLQHYIP